jgi:hypothetical protein
VSRYLAVTAKKEEQLAMTKGIAGWHISAASKKPEI